MLLLKEYSVVFMIVYISIFSVKCCTSEILGPCPRLPNMESFNISRFTGHWFEIERSFSLMELVRICVGIDLKEKVKGRLDVSINTKSRWTGTFSISEGVAWQSKTKPSIFQYKVNTSLPRMFNKYLPGAGLYQVLRTDYENYAVIYTCTNFQIVHTDMIWIWGRRREIDAETRSEIYFMLESLELDSERLLLPRNNNCTDY